MNDKQQGQGAMTWLDGRKYVGEFKSGMFHGQGTYSHSDGSGYVGEWKENKAWNGTEYKGEGVVATWAEGVRHRR